VTLVLSAPSPLGDGHEVADFCCGVASLDDWIKRRARTNQASGATRTFVMADGTRVVAYYALASGAIAAAGARGRFRRNMPDPIPVAVLARLAIDRHWQGQGLGRALIRDCMLRVLQAAELVGIRGIVVHALSDQAHRFYVALGFEQSPLDRMTLMVTLADLRANFTTG